MVVAWRASIHALNAPSSLVRAAVRSPWKMLIRSSNAPIALRSSFMSLMRRPASSRSSLCTSIGSTVDAGSKRNWRCRPSAQFASRSVKLRPKPGISATFDEVTSAAVSMPQERSTAQRAGPRL